MDEPDEIDLWMKSMDRATLLGHCRRLIEDQLAAGIERSARGVYYDLVGAGLAPQDRKEPGTNKQTRRVYRRIIDTIAKAKLSGDFPLDYLRDDLRIPVEGEITDRLIDVGAAFDKFEEYLNWLPRWLIRVDRWYNQPILPVVVVEKDTLIGTIKGPCEERKVPYYLCRGYSSIPGLWALAKYIRSVQDSADWNPSIRVLYIGDHDPEGMDIPRSAAERMAQLYEIKGWHNPPTDWQRVALTFDQAQDGNYPPMDVKVDSARAPGYVEKYGEETWEAEAMSSRKLQSVLNEAIAECFDDEIRAEETEPIDDLRKKLKQQIRDNFEEMLERAFE